MDRNEEFRKRLEKRLNPMPKQTFFVGKRSFDPTPYIDILMEKTLYEDMEDINEFMEEVLADPDVDFILGESSLLNSSQKEKTMLGFAQRVIAYHEFDPQPYVEALISLYGTPAFDEYLDVDEDDGEEFLDFSSFYAKHDFTKEQKELIFETFVDHQSAAINVQKQLNNRKLSKGEAIWGFMIITIFVIVPSFFAPKFLQYMGWLPADAGWFIKIVLFIISFIVLAWILNKIVRNIK